MLKKSKTAKLLSMAVGASMVLSFAIPASAQTTAELTAMINSLLAQINQLQAQLNAQGGSTVGAGTTFTKDLTVGSTGSEVTALQQWLVGKGFLTMPAGTAYGYFGNLTKAALAKYQVSAGISPAAGYFGPITRARVNATVGGTTGGTTTGGTTTGGTTTGGITTPGAEGTLTVTSNNSGLVSTVYEGDNMAPIYGFTAEAKSSDIAIQRIKVDLGTATTIYNKGYSKLYVTEGGNVVASSDLNSSTVVKDGTHYYITITGFNLVVPKGGKKNIVLKADVMPSIDSTDMDGSGTTDLENLSIAIPANGVRGVDGAGIDQYGPASALTGRSETFSATLSDSATLRLSLNSSSPKKQDLVATAGSGENEMDKVTVLVMDAKAEKDDVTITDLRVEIDETSGSAANVPTLYLYDGSTEIDSASVVDAGDDYATFSDIDYVVPKDSIKTFTVKTDVRGATAVRTGYTAAASSTDVTAENSRGDTVTVSGTATGNEIGFTNVGAEITLVSKSVTTNGAPQVGGTNAPSTSTISATFNVRVKALGSDILLGTTASGTPFFEDTGTSPSFTVFKNGAVDATVSSVATSTAYTIPSLCVSEGTATCRLSEGTEVSFPITVQLLGRKSTGVALDSGLYSIQFALANVIPVDGAAQVMNFMNNEADWRTADVSFP